MTFWTPARTESLQAPPHWKCGGISNISHWQKDQTAGVHTQAWCLFSLLLYIFCVSFFTPHKYGSCQIGSKARRLQMESFTLSQVSPLAEVFQKKKKKKDWEFVITDFKLCRLSRHSSSCSNRHPNVNVSLAQMIGPESLCVCLMPKCLKCRLCAPLDFSSSTPLSFLCDFVADAYAEKKTFLTSYKHGHIWSEYSVLNAFHRLSYLFGPKPSFPFKIHE